MMRQHMWAGELTWSTACWYMRVRCSSCWGKLGMVDISCCSSTGSLATVDRGHNTWLSYMYTSINATVCLIFIAGSWEYQLFKRDNT